jgi:hypothetical protein
VPSEPPPPPPSPERAYVVFAQGEARLDVGAWDAHAERFFRTRIGTTEPSPSPNAVCFVVAPQGAAPGTRWAYARPRATGDLALADAAEARAGGGGLALLARRCPTVWLVARETEDDRLALRLAAILAGVLLGPILDVRGPEIFGVKTARGKLDA